MLGLKSFVVAKSRELSTALDLSPAVVGGVAHAGNKPAQAERAVAEAADAGAAPTEGGEFLEHHRLQLDLALERHHALVSRWVYLIT